MAEERQKADEVIWMTPEDASAVCEEHGFVLGALAGVGYAPLDEAGEPGLAALAVRLINGRMKGSVEFRYRAIDEGEETIIILRHRDFLKLVAGVIDEILPDDE